MRCVEIDDVRYAKLGSEYWKVDGCVRSSLLSRRIA